ncbi:MAG: MoaD/ThiS family protein [Spirochaetaceae bacterium]|nr:MoaD/ThiS family protein [Spirochaetaceae bacterium]
MAAGAVHEVRLFATLRTGRGKVVVLETERPSTPAELLGRLGIRREEVAILLVNGRDGSFDAPLATGDYLSVFPPVGGG